MKKLSFILILFIGIFTVACTKKTVDPTYPIEGLWVGKYGTGTATPTNGFSMVVESDGKVTVADGSSITSSSKASGTWTLVDNVFKATFTYTGGNTFSIQANFSNNGKLQNGTYGPNATPTGSGNWYMDRVN